MKKTPRQTFRDWLRRAPLPRCLATLVVFIGGVACSKTGASAAEENPAATSIESCGQGNDDLSRIPANDNSFAPPAKGGKYTDPQFGCTVTRLTDARADFNAAVHHHYSTISPINEDSTLVLLATEEGRGAIVDLAGNVVVRGGDFPDANSVNMPWARSPANAFFYTRGNALYRGTVARRKVSSTVVRKFAGRDPVVIPDQEDISEDGDHLWLVSGEDAFLYRISTDTIAGRFQVGAKDKDCGWHKLQITPSNKLLVTWSCNGPGLRKGQEVYNTDGTLDWHMFDSSIHTDVGKDLAGNEVAVVSRIPDTYKDACPSGGGVNSIRLAAPHTVSCLVDVNWASTHISYRDSSKGWVAVSVFDQGNCPSHSCFSDPKSPMNVAPVWKRFYEEVFLVKIDGSLVRRLAHHRSRSAEYYWAQSRAAISRDGRFVVMDSNMGIHNTGLPNYTDVYLIQIN